MDRRKEYKTIIKQLLLDYAQIKPANGDIETEVIFDEDRERFKTEFLRDVKDRIKEVTKRGYINAEEQTLDYLILLIPNERIYGFILENLPEIIEDSLAKKFY